MDTPLEILYQDDHLVAINKPAGLLVHRTALERRATEFAVQRLRDQLGRSVHPCHRLDRPTSGVLLFALDKESLTEVSRAFQTGAVDKTYHALVRGWTAEAGEIDSPLRSEDTNGKVQEALTRYRRLAASELNISSGRYPSTRLSLLELRPRTGRTHQLRRHLAHIRHPILGDTRHGDGKLNRFARETLQADRLLLHATQLKLAHPVTGETLRIRAKWDSTFDRGLKRSKIDDAPH